ncbi:MAG: YkgJ family cysteine cluster protein, partial [Bdellovibrionales bacterium]
MKPNPCLGCGACCAFFRVQFYWSEEVPSALSVDLDSRHRCMRGTEKKHRPKCIALVGRIGQNAKCGVYENRPTPCRRVEASYENGVRKPR